MVFDHMKHKERTVLLQPDQDVSELCFLEAERVESLGVRNEAPGYVTTVREIVAPDAAADEQLEALLEAYGRQVSYFIHRFHSRAWRPYCSGSRYRYLRDRLVEAVAKKEEEGKKSEKKPEEKKSEKEPEERRKPEMKPEAPFPIFGLQARQWKMALQQASSVVENDWALAQQRAKEKIERTRWYANLDGNERHYVNLLLSTMGDDFFLMMRGRTATFGWHRDREQLKKVKNPGSLCALVRRAIQKVKSKQIRRRACRSVWFDCECYSVQIVTEGKETIQVVSLMSLTPGKRVKIKLRGKKAIKGTVKLVKTPRGWQLHTLSTPKTKEKSSEGKLTCAAMDMGFSEVFTMHDGAQFGRKLGEAIGAQAETVDLKIRERNRLTAQAKNTKDPKKRRNILRYNLGSDTFDRNVAKHRSRVHNIVNHSLNEMLKQYPAEVYVVEDLSHRFYLKGFSKQTNRLLLELGSGHHCAATEFQSGSARRESCQSACCLQFAALSVLRLRLSGIPQGRPFRMRALRSQRACGQSGLPESPLPSARSAFPLENVEGKGVGTGVGGARDGVRAKRHDAAQVRTETKEKAVNAE